MNQKVKLIFFEPCKCPRRWVCVDVIDSSNIIFKKK